MHINLSFIPAFHILFQGYHSKYIFIVTSTKTPIDDLEVLEEHILTVCYFAFQPAGRKIQRVARADKSSIESGGTRLGEPTGTNGRVVQPDVRDIR